MRFSVRLAFPALTALTLSGCTSDSGSDPTTTEPGPAAPTACDATMDWTPFEFSGPVVHVGPVVDGGDGSVDRPFSKLEDAILAAPDGATIRIADGVYEAPAAPYTDPSCANCSKEEDHPVEATLGYALRGKSLAIVAEHPGEARLLTRAGYGLLIEDACEVRLEGIVLTEGARDENGDAADAALVVRRSRVTAHRVTIEENRAKRAGGEYPGIIGIAVRDGSDVLVTESTLQGNSWDGIAVYGDGKLRVYGSTIKNGNGVGVGVTWDGKADIVGNTISGYWKGIGAFVRADVEARNNLIHRQRGWGLATNGSGTLRALNNTLAYNDQLGVLANPGSHILLVNNVIAYNGLNRIGGFTPETFGQGGIRGPAPTKGGVVEAHHNMLFGNVPEDWRGQTGKTSVARESWGPSNRSEDPVFVSENDMTPGPGSPLVDAGDPELSDPDGTASDIGYTGGPMADMRKP